MIWNLDCPEPVIKNPVRTISHHPDVVLSMSFNTDGSLLATTCKDRKVRLMESRSGTLLRVLLCARVHFSYLPFFCNGGENSKYLNLNTLILGGRLRLKFNYLSQKLQMVSFNSRKFRPAYSPCDNLSKLALICKRKLLNCKPAFGPQ